MIIWGGGDFVIATTGARYNPVTNSWRATSTINAPAPGVYTAVWTGSEMIVWSGVRGWKIQSQFQQLDSHQHDQRALTSRRAHGSLEWQRNDRVGRHRRLRFHA